MFFRKNRPDGELSAGQLAEKLETLETLQGATLNASRSLLVLLKAFALDVQELATEDFRKRIDELGERLQAADSGNALDKTVKKTLPGLERFIEQQQAHLTERESELRGAINLLSDAMALLNRENQDYHRNILQQGENLQRLMGLDDLRKIKSSLAQEVSALERIVQTKQQAEKKRLDLLSQQVETLNLELEKTRDESRRDPLTGLFNRRALQDYLQELVDGNQLKVRAFAVIAIDIDNFKQINDTFGHLIGDSVIKAVAEGCLEIFREEDHVSRFGGEEFLIVMAGSSLRTARKRAETLRRAIENTRFTTSEEDDGAVISFTISLGVTEYRRGDTSHTIIDRADHALLEAKRQGKNQVVSA